MSFLAPILLFGLPLAALPVIIHLIHLYRRRQVKWAAMMFLLMAQKMNKGLSRLRQILILAFRVLAVLALIFVVSRPLAGGLLGLTGGAPDTVVILLDRSASMEQQNLGGLSKRASGLRKLTQAIKDTVGNRSRLVLIDSALGQAQVIEKADALPDLPQAGATDTTADVTALLQGALDYITVNQTGRTDVWLLSDLRQNDWDATNGRWQPLRSAFASLQGIRFHILSYPQPAKENVAVTVERVTRRETADKAELLLDLRITRNEETPQPAELPLRFVVNGASSTHKVEIKENQLLIQGHSLPIDKATKRGWGRVELPADTNGSDNASHFVFDEPAILKSVIVSDDIDEAEALKAALSAPADPARKYAAVVLPVARAAEIVWDETALIVWHAQVPKADDILAQQLNNQVAAGRAILFLPPENPTADVFMGLSWDAWKNGGGNSVAVEWWRNDASLLANTRDGASLPVGDLEVTRQCAINGDGVPLARTVGNQPLLMRAASERDGSAFFLGTLPGSGSSSLARDGVVLFAMLHRALNDGARGLGKAQQRFASRTALGSDLSGWKRTGGAEATPVITTEPPLRNGILENGDKLVALNRPVGEDTPQSISKVTLDELFEGLDYQYLEDTLEGTKSLASEVWRTFLIMMALALLGEALLCMPQKRAVVVEQTRTAAVPAAA